MTGRLRQFDSRLRPQSQLIGIFDDVIDALSGARFIEKIVAGNHQCVLHVDGTVQSQAAWIIAGAGLIDLLTVDERFPVDDTGRHTADGNHRLVDGTRHIDALRAVVHQRAQRVGA